MSDKNDNSEVVEKSENKKSVELNLNDTSELCKITLQMLYYIEHGIRRFRFKYSCKDSKISLDQLISKMKMHTVFKLVKQYDLKLCFTGFPKCIFDKYILRPDLRWYFEKNISFYSCNDDVSTFTKKEGCVECLFDDSCDGLPQCYIDKFEFTKIIPLFSNELLFGLNEEVIKGWKNEKIKILANKVLDDFKGDNLYMKKRFLFSKRYPCIQSEFKEAFNYHIYNRIEDFEETYVFLKEFFNSDMLKSLKIFLSKSNLIVLNFSVEFIEVADDNDKEIFKSVLYFKINDFNLSELNELSSLLNMDFDYQNVWAIGMEFSSDSGVVYRVLYDYEKVKAFDIKNFLTDIKLENKMPMLKFANSITKPVYNVRLGKRVKDGTVISKSIDVSLDHNYFRLNQLSILFGINLNNYKDKKVTNLKIEVSNSYLAKITLDYMPIPKEIIDETKVSKFKYYNKNY